MLPSDTAEENAPLKTEGKGGGSGMLGADFSQFGETHQIVGRLEDSKLWRLATKVRWLDRSTVIIIDHKGISFFLSQRGHVEVCLRQQLDTEQQGAGSKDDDGKEEERHEYWFDDPRALIISRKEREEYLAELRRQASAARAAYVEPTKTIVMPLLAADFAGFIKPDTGDFQVAAADTASQTIKILERDSWHVDRELGGLGNAPGNFFGISGLSMLKVDDDCTLFCTCDKDLGLIQILELDGKVRVTVSAEGPLEAKGQPTAITTHIRQSVSSFENPAWFVGEILHKSELEAHLLDRVDLSLGDFCLGRLAEDERVYNLVYLGKNSRTITLVLRREPPKKGSDEPGGVFWLTAQGHGTIYPSFWHFILAQKFLHKPAIDARPYALIAVADEVNARVGIYRYHWTSSEIFNPSLEHYLTIGGIRRRFYDLQGPRDVSYSPTGELAICDTDSVIIMAPTMNVTKILTHEYSPFLLTREQREHRDAETKEQRIAEEKHLEKLSKAQQQGKKEAKQADNDSVHVNADLKWPAWAYRDVEMTSAADSSSHSHRQQANRRPVSASFATDGKLAIAYKSGGVLLFEKYKSQAGGALTTLPTANFDLILSFCSFEALQAIRDCSRLFHNYTRDLRFQWRLGDMRAKYNNIMIYQFLRWATLNTSEFAFHADIFRDRRGELICKHHLQTGSCPLNKSCPFSHESLPSLGFREFFPDALQLGLEYRQLLLCCYAVMGPHFVWQHEKYIEALFTEYSDVVPRLQMKQERPRHTVGGEMLRNIQVEDTRVMGIKDYINVMTWLEEDLTHCKPIHTHLLFYRHNLTSFQPSGPNHFESIDKRIYVDPLEQYTGGLKMSCVPLRTRAVKMLQGMQDQTRGVDMDQKSIHVETYRGSSDRISDLCLKMFKK